MGKAGIALIILVLIGACLFLNLALPRGMSESEVEQTKIAMIQQGITGASAATQRADDRLYTATADARTATAQIHAATATAAWEATEVQQIVDRNSANATLQAAQATAQYLNSQATATQQAIYYQQTAVVEDQNRQATTQAERATQTAAALRKTETAYAAQQTAQAQATATERAWILTQTAQAGYTTQTGQSVQSTATRQADVASIQRTAEAVQAESLALSLERERMSNIFAALGPWVAGFVIVIVLLFVVWRWSKVQMVGKVLVIDGRTVYDPARNPVPWMNILKDGRIDAPLLAPPQMQADTTRRDQFVEALEASHGLPVSSQERLQRVFPGAQSKAEEPPAQHTPVIEIIMPEQIQPWLDEVETKYLPDVEEQEGSV